MKIFDELLKCSHCGGIAQFHESVDCISIGCIYCGISTNREYGHDTENRKLKVIQVWNNRVK